LEIEISVDIRKGEALSGSKATGRIYRAARDVAEGMPMAVDASRWSLAEAWRRTPVAFVLSVLSALVLALTPAAQVQVVAWLVRNATSFATAWVPLVLLVVLVGAGQVLSSADLFTRQRAGVKLMRTFQDSLVRRLVGMSPQELEDSKMSANVQLCRTSLRDLGNLPWSVMSSASSLLTFVALFVSVWFIAPRASIVIALSLIPSLVVFSWSASRQSVMLDQVGNRLRRTTYLIEQLAQQRSGTEISAFGSGGRLAAKISENQTRADSVLDHLLTLLIRGSAIGGAVGAALLGIALSAIVFGGAGGSGIAAGVLGVVSGIEATRGAGFAIGDILKAAPRVKTFRDVVDHPVDMTPIPVVPDVGSLAAQSITVTYPRARHPALDSASIQVSRGEAVAIVGANGAGKTTLVKALMGLLPVSHGEVFIDSRRASDLPLRARLAHFGLLTQEFGRYELTIRDAISLGMPDGAEVNGDDIWRALSVAHLSEFVQSLDEGLDTQIGEQYGGIGLSGGQWQRISLARIAVRNAGIWILDEPTSAVDAEAEREIFHELLESRQDRITIVVSHRAWTLRGMDRIYVLDGGRVVQCGTYEELVASRGRFHELFMDQ
jgi:ATP-binding cassette, subfamily B, bacterial